MIDAAAKRLDEATAKKMLGATHWAHDDSWRASLERLAFSPTVNIQGLVGGYMGPGGKTMLPNKALAKLDLRLVPDMTFDGAIAALKAHLAKRGFGDIEVNVSGGYGPTETSADAPLIRAQMAVYKRAGLDPMLWVRNAGSYPGYVFTGEPLKLASGHFGLGHGSGAHAPDEYFVIESTNPKVAGFDGAGALVRRLPLRAGSGPLRRGRPRVESEREEREERQPHLDEEPVPRRPGELLGRPHGEGVCRRVERESACERNGRRHRREPTEPPRAEDEAQRHEEPRESPLLAIRHRVETGAGRLREA